MLIFISIWKFISSQFLFSSKIFSVLHFFIRDSILTRLNSRGCEIFLSGFCVENFVSRNFKENTCDAVNLYHPYSIVYSCHLKLLWKFLSYEYFPFSLILSCYIMDHPELKLSRLLKSGGNLKLIFKEDKRSENFSIILR
jgi:hypothetical protein